MPEPTGVVAVLAPQQSSLLGLVSVLAPVLAGGNTAVVVTSKERPLPAVTLGEVLATSDVPGGVVNLLTGDAGGARPLAGRARRRRRASTSAAPRPAGPWSSSGRRPEPSSGCCARAPEPDWTADPGLSRMTPFLETKTVWHPIGV